MAFGTYHKGDTVYITVNYDEVIDDAWLPFAFLGNIEGVYVTDATCLGSYGSNALVFEAIVSEDFEITPDANNVLVNTKPVVATVWDVLGNGYD